MNILILGGTGYLGNNIIHRLSEDKHNIFCTVHTRSNKQKEIDVDYIGCRLEDIENLFLHTKIDWVVNAVCVYNSNESLYDDMIDANIVFPLKVLNIAAKYGVNNYITMGTSLPKYTNMYSLTKHMFFELAYYLSKEKMINFIELRLEMFYGGESEPEDRFIPRCIKKLILNEPLFLTEGTQKRDLIRVEDVVEIVALLIRNNFTSILKILPVGSGENHSIREIVYYLSNCVRSKSELHFGNVTGRPKEPDTLSDIRWYSELKFSTKYSFFEGLSEECNRIITILKEKDYESCTN